MAPYEALYGRKCQSPLCWYEPGEQSLLGPDLVWQTTEQIKRIRERILTTQSRQKSYTDKRRKPIEFQEGEHIFLKITPATGISRAIRVKKLSPHFLGPFQILKRIRIIAYQIALQPQMYSHLLEPKNVQLREDLTFNLPPMRIIDRKVKQLRSNSMPLVKVAWGRESLEEHTWELDAEMRREYPNLFIGNKF